MPGFDTVSGDSAAEILFVDMGLGLGANVYRSFTDRLGVFGALSVAAPIVQFTTLITTNCESDDINTEEVILDEVEVAFDEIDVFA